MSHFLLILVVLSFCFLSTVNLWKIYKAVEALGGYDSVSISLMLSRTVATPFAQCTSFLDIRYYLYILSATYGNTVHKNVFLFLEKVHRSNIYRHSFLPCCHFLVWKKWLWVVKSTNSNIVTVFDHNESRMSIS